MITPSNYRGIYLSSKHESPRKVNAFKDAANHTLDKINSGTSGRRLLNDISTLSSKKERKVTLRETNINEDNVSTVAVLTRHQLEKYSPDSFSENTSIAKSLSEKQTVGKGKGTSAMIYWDPKNSSIELNGNGSPVRISDAGSSDRFTTLAHELIHAKHMMNGTTKSGYRPSERYDSRTAAGKEEMRAVGVGTYAYSRTGEPSENSIRQEHGLPLRKRY